MSHVDFKIILLGNQGVGKTSIFQRYLYSTYNTGLKTTLGAVFGSKNVSYNGKNFSIGIWDTAGSERYYSMTRVYYRGAKVAIICFDPGNEESWSRVSFWVEDLRNVEEECKIYVCATKKDLLDDGSLKWAVDRHDVQDFVEEIPGSFFKISSKTGDGIEELFEKIVKDCGSDSKLLKAVADEKALQKYDQIEDTSVTPKHKSRMCC